MIISTKPKHSSVATSTPSVPSPEIYSSSVPLPEYVSQYPPFQVLSACSCILVPYIATSTVTAESRLASTPLISSPLASSPLASRPPSKPPRSWLSVKTGVALGAALIIISGAVGFFLYQRKLQQQRINLKNEQAGTSTRTSDLQNLQLQDQPWFPEMEAPVHVLEADGGIRNELGAGSGMYG